MLTNKLQYINRMNGLIGLLLMSTFLFNACIPGISSSSSTKASSSYSEDLSAYRPTVELEEDTATEALSSQSDFRVTSENYDPKTDVTESLNAKLDTLNNNNASIRYVNGFAIQVYSGASSSEAYQARDSIMRYMPELRPKVEYDQPIYKVRAGSFIERLELQQTILQIKSIFPDAISVPSRVKIN